MKRPSFATALYLSILMILVSCRLVQTSQAARDGGAALAADKARLGTIWSEKSWQPDDRCLLQLGPNALEQTPCARLLQSQHGLSTYFPLEERQHKVDSKRVDFELIAFCTAADRVTNIQDEDARFALKTNVPSIGTLFVPNPSDVNWLWIHPRCLHPTTAMWLEEKGYVRQELRDISDATERPAGKDETVPYVYYARFGGALFALLRADGRVTFFAGPGDAIGIGTYAVHDDTFASLEKRSSRLALQIRDVSSGAPGIPEAEAKKELSMEETIRELREKWDASAEAARSIHMRWKGLEDDFNYRKEFHEAAVEASRARLELYEAHLRNDPKFLPGACHAGGNVNGRTIRDLFLAAAKTGAQRILVMRAALHPFTRNIDGRVIDMIWEPERFSDTEREVMIAELQQECRNLPSLGDVSSEGEYRCTTDAIQQCQERF